jgi:glutathione synthase/RimK-type ligase-like ATP-grasp enzyme
MKGLLIYVKEDYEKNKSYVNWLIDEFKIKDVELILKFEDEIINEGININENIKFIINRSRNYNITLEAELCNIRVFNKSDICLLGNNKLLAYRYAESKGYLYPDIILDWNNKNKKDIISKTTDGHGGCDVTLLEHLNINSSKNRFQQKLIKDIIGDIRFYIIGNKIIHAVLRTSNKLVSNFSKGGNIQVYNFNSKEKQYVEKFINDLEIDFAGVDFFLTKNKELIFNEIEDVVGSRMLSVLNLNNTTELFVNHILEEIKIINKIKDLEEDYKSLGNSEIKCYEDLLEIDSQQEFILNEIEKLKSNKITSKK